VHFTPTGGSRRSWLNQVERWFALLTQRAIKLGAHTSTNQLERAIRDFIDAHNQAPKPFVWTKPADDILASISRFAAQTSKIHANN
jgi:phage-related protein